MMTTDNQETHNYEKEFLLTQNELGLTHETYLCVNLKPWTMTENQVSSV